jgi:DNA-binding beta-propeller fold protein YncE
MRALGLLLLLAACSPVAEAPPAPSGPPQLELIWRLAGFANPESVILSVDGQTLYVTNINGDGQAEDGNGFISRVSPSGEMLQREFATGLDAPKGIALVADAIYVTDINDVVVVDAATGQTRRRVAIPGAQFLNDIVFTHGGLVLVTDSITGRIHSIAHDASEVWLEDPLLESINGLLSETDRLIVSTMEGRLLAIDYQTRAVTVLAEGLGEGDGIGALGGGRYLFGEWPGLMQVVNADGTHETILDTRAEERLLTDFQLIGDTLYQTHLQPGELTAYRVVQ